MPISGNFYRFDEEDIERAPTGKGVYSLYKAGEIIYIGKAEGGGGIRGRLQYHLHGKDTCTKQATAYCCEYSRDPTAGEKELLFEYKLAHGMLPLCNKSTG